MAQLQWIPVQNNSTGSTQYNPEKIQADFWVQSPKEAVNLDGLNLSPEEYYKTHNQNIALINKPNIQAIQMPQVQTQSIQQPINTPTQDFNSIEPSRDYYINTFTDLARKAGYNNQQIAYGLAQLEGESNFEPVNEVKFTYKNLMDIRGAKKTPYITLQKRLLQMTPEQIKAMQADDKAYFNTFYGGRLGNINPDDGYKYRGRGLIQVTGKDNYARLGKKLGIDLVNNPDLLNNPEYAARAAFQFLVDNKVFNAKSLNDATTIVHGSSNNHVTNRARQQYYNNHYAKLNRG